METLRLILVSVLGLLISFRPSAEEVNPIAVNGFIAGSFYDSPNKINYPYYESGINISYRINDHFSIDTSAQSKDGDSFSVNTAFVSFESSILDSGFSTEIRLGKNRTYLGLSNYSRFYPASRTFIFMPQGIYWAPMDELVGSSVGSMITIKHDSGFALQLNDTKANISNSRPINESTFIPGTIKRADIEFIGLTYTGRNLYAGAQKIKFKFNQEVQILPIKPELYMELYFIRLHDCLNELALEMMKSSSSLNKLDGNNSPQQSYSVTYSRSINDDLKVSFNFNRTSYNHPSELSNFEGKNTTTEKIVGFTFKNVGIKNMTIKLEEHFVKGVSWLTSDLNPNGFDTKWNMFVAQMIYQF